MITFEEYQFKVKHSSIGAQIYKYQPNTKDELIKVIEAEIKLQGSEADLNCIDTSKILFMSSLFDASIHAYAKDFNGDISGWNVSNVKMMRHIFNKAKAFNQDISSRDVRRVEDASYAFDGCPIEEKYKPKFNENI